MKLKYNREDYVLRISLSKELVSESDEAKPGIIIDYSVAQQIVGIEIRNASTKWRRLLKWNMKMPEF